MKFTSFQTFEPKIKCRPKLTFKICVFSKMAKFVKNVKKNVAHRIKIR